MHELAHEGRELRRASPPAVHQQDRVVPVTPSVGDQFVVPDHDGAPPRAFVRGTVIGPDGHRATRGGESRQRGSPAETRG